MKVSDIIEVRPAHVIGKALFSGRLTGSGMVEVTKPSREEAATATVERVRNIVENHGRRAYYFAVDGTCFAVHYAHGAWGYDIVRTDEGSKKATRVSSVIIGNDFEECCEYASRHANTY